VPTEPAQIDFIGKQEFYPITDKARDLVRRLADARKLDIEVEPAE
jgi:hypothetical protein